VAVQTTPDGFADQIAGIDRAQTMSGLWFATVKIENAMLARGQAGDEADPRGCLT